MTIYHNYHKKYCVIYVINPKKFSWKVVKKKIPNIKYQRNQFEINLKSIYNEFLIFVEMGLFLYGILYFVKSKNFFDILSTLITIIFIEKE